MLTVDGKLLARAGYTYLGRLYSEMDCQAFVEKCLSDCGLKINLAGSNTWYRRMTWTGSPEECMKKFGKIPEGAFLFILKQDGKEPVKFRGDGIGNACHIGIYTGRGKGAIHSSESQGCVVESRFTGKTIPNGGWNRVGLWEKVRYSGIILEKGQEEKKVESSVQPVKAKVVPTSTSGGDSVNLRSGPGKNFNTILKNGVPFYSEIEVLEDLGQWCKIGWQGKTGYMMSDFIEYGNADSETNEVKPEQLLEVSNRLDEIEKKMQLIDQLRKQITEALEFIGEIVGRG